MTENNNYFKGFLQEQYDNFKNNPTANYVYSIFEKYKFAIIFIIVIIIISTMEIIIARNVCDKCYTLNQNKILKIHPNCYNLYDDEFIYVYNGNNFNKTKVIEKANIKNLDNYYKENVKKHVNDIMLSPFKKMKQTLKNFNQTATPVNDIAGEILNAYKISTFSDVSNNIDGLNSPWFIIYPKHIKLTFFVSKNKIYLNGK